MKRYLWAVVGAGPAGIAAVGKLLDQGVQEQDIIWIDPKFTVGDFGSIWQNVPSNTKVDLFLKFLHACHAFNYATCEEDFDLNHAPRDKTCHLHLMAAPLQWITEKLKSRVHSVRDIAKKLIYKNRSWFIHLSDSVVQVENIILAVGAEPKSLSYQKPSIPLQDAMDSQRIGNHIHPDETIALFGSSHSAILVLRNLIENSAKKVINFYRSPLLYAIYYDDHILHDDTGLKGTTAEWARAHLEGVLPNNLQRVYSNEENINHYLPLCDKTIYAIGFARRKLLIEGWDDLTIKTNGVIAPGLFGFGIAFPEARYNQLGMLEHRVGLWKFMDYLQRVMPVWLNESI